MSQEENQEKGFRVSDRRRFSGEGKTSQEREEKAEESRSTGQTEKAEEPGAKTEQKESKRAQTRELPPVNFATFVISLSSSVLIHMGLVEDPMSGQVNRDLALARQTIDILGMLQEKTRGNLSEEEGRLMESILYDLRMHFVEESRKERS